MRKAFTLIELLVVITIIVVLLALLVPAMDQAIYQAEMAGCAAQMGGAAKGAVTYAFDHKRRYPHRKAADYPDIGYFEPRSLTAPTSAQQKHSATDFDDRPTMAPYINIDALQCPPAGSISLSRPGSNSHINASMSMWFGFKYWGNDGATPSPGMEKMGDRVRWEGERFAALIGDTFFVVQFAAHTYGSHPDPPRNTMSHFSRDDQPFDEASKAGWGDADGTETYTLWLTLTANRPKVDLNFAFDDGSVRLYRQVPNTFNDPKAYPGIREVPVYSNRDDSTSGSWLAIPKEK